MSAADVFQVAIIGAGPAGLYAADELLKRDSCVRVDMFDRLPTPGGLVRSGVSPDHCQRRKMIQVYERQISSSGRFRFFGETEVGQDILLAELRSRYSAVLFSSGATADTPLGIEGELLPGCVASREFVAWYNGHPDHSQNHYAMSCDRAVVIGNGNVALDVARMLLLSPEYLAQTDISETALLALRQSTIKEVVIIGRRGPVQAAFTLPELLELKNLPIGIEIDGDIPQLNTGRGELQLRLRTLRELAGQHPDAERRLVFRFLRSPTAILGRDRTEGVELVINQLSDDGEKVIPSSATFRLKTNLVIKAVGYRVEPWAGLSFDESRGVIANEGGRIEAGLYVAGWLKRGPRGVIGTNKGCSRETVTGLLADQNTGALPRRPLSTSISGPVI